MKQEELIRLVSRTCRKNGTRVNMRQVRKIFEAFKEVTIEACQQGDYVRLVHFITIRGAETTCKQLPNGDYLEPRLKLKAEVSRMLQEEFRDLVLGIERDEDESW